MVDRSAERVRILDTAYQLLDRNGGEELEVTQILSETGLGTRAFYRHFKTRDELMLVMLRRDRDHVLDRLRTVVAEAQDPVDALRRWVEMMFSLLTEPRRKRRVLTFHSEEMQRTRGYSRELARFTAAEQAILAQVLSEGRIKGHFPDVDPGPDARSVRAVIEAALLEQAEHPTDVSTDQTAENALGFVLRALGYQQSSKAANG